MGKKYITFAWAMLLGLLAVDLHAATLDPALQEILQSADPNERIPVIVRFSEPANLDQNDSSPRSVRRAAMIRSLQTRLEKNRRSIEQTLKQDGETRAISLWIINAVSATASPSIIRKLAAQPNVTDIRFDAPISALEPEIEPLPLEPPARWNLDALKASALWARGIKGQGVVIAVLDTGVDSLHDDLRTRWRGGANSWFDPFGQHTTPYDYDRLESHGTAAAGIIVGGDATGTSIGLAPDAQWIAAKIWDDSGRTNATAIHRCFQWILDPDGNPETDDAPDVVSNSWGLQSNLNQCVNEYLADVRALKRFDIAVVFAAGNSGPSPSTSMSPANYSESFAVGSINDSMTIEPSSSRGPSACDKTIYPETVAPGALIRTCDRTLGGGNPKAYQIVSGTSFAAPHIAGAMALLRSALPESTAAEIESALIHTAVDLGTPGPDNAYGFGLPDLEAAYDYLLRNYRSGIRRGAWLLYE